VLHDHGNNIIDRCLLESRPFQALRTRNRQKTEECRRRARIRQWLDRDDRERPEEAASLLIGLIMKLSPTM
jgi:hypothetical protein